MKYKLNINKGALWKSRIFKVFLWNFTSTTILVQTHEMKRQCFRWVLNPTSQPLPGQLLAFSTPWFPHLWYKNKAILISKATVYCKDNSSQSFSSSKWHHCLPGGWDQVSLMILLLASINSKWLASHCGPLFKIHHPATSIQHLLSLTFLRLCWILRRHNPQQRLA